MRLCATKSPPAPERDEVGDVDELRPPDRPEVERAQELDRVVQRREADDPLDRCRDTS